MVKTCFHNYFLRTKTDRLDGLNAQKRIKHRVNYIQVMRDNKQQNDQMDINESDIFGTV